jgi:Alanyl-tRNA synthetase
MLGMEKPFFHKLVKSLESEMGDAYPELRSQREHVERILLQEEERFAETLSQGMRILESVIEDRPEGGVVSGETVFKLYDTYGFPKDLAAVFLRDRVLRLDVAGFV